MVDVHLYDSTICRLCAASNGNEHLFVSETGEPDLSSLVNRYLPLKIHDDGKLPRTICPGCNIQLEATAQFFELLVAGQRKIRELWKHQVEKQRKAERFRGKKENAEFEAEGTEMDSTAQYNEDEQYEQQIIIKIMPDGSMYAVEHEMSLQMEGLTKPKRKRGRPPKVNAEEDSVATKENPAEAGSQGEEDKQEEEEEVDGDGRRRRKRKVPKRYLEAVQGKELERIFKEEGVIDEEDNNSQIFDGPADLLKSSNQEDGQEEVIGHLETEEGTDLGEVVTVNRGRSKSKWRRRKNKFTCQLCGRGFLQRSKYIVHKSFHMGIKHECTQCKKLFESKESLTLHQETTKHNSNHTEENIEVQKSQKSHETHNVEQTTSTVTPEIAKDSRKAIYTCEKCNKQFGLKQEYELHMRVVHEQQKFTCNTCKKSFTNESDLKTHMTTHGKTKYNYPCDICGKVLNHPSSVLYHKEAEHNNGRRFVCNKCNKSFKHKQLLQRHQLVHSDNRPHVCKSCNASFKTKANLINHQSTHTGQKKYNCELCKQQFAHKTSLTLHYRWHSGQKPFKCKECGKSFSQNGNLQEHIRIHTGEKPYSCDFCGRKFTTSSQFKLHVKRHTGERPWKCEFCAKTFLHKDTWKCHVRRHKGERPFQCSTCKRSFTEQWALKKHIRLHTGEKPYSCDVCNKAFADCSNLTKHKKVHREDKMPPTNKSEGSSIGQVWQILPNSVRQVDERTFSNQIIATDETSNDGIQQIIYVSYQDPSDSNERTFHMIDANKNKDEIVASVNSLSRLDMENNEIIGDRIMSNAASSNDDQSEIELTEPDLQLQITDEHGNPIPLTIQEARQLLSQGHFVSQFNDNQIMRLHPGMFATQQLQALNIHVDEDTMEETGIIVRPNTHKNIEALSAIQADADAIVQALEDEDTDATAVATINQLGNIEQTEFVNGEQTIEFVTQDGQKLRVLTSQLASEYVTIA